MEQSIALDEEDSIATRPTSLLKLIIILGALTAFNTVSIDMYLPAFPQMAKDLRAPIGTVQLSISAYLFGSAFGQIFYGPLADRWGRKPPLIFGLVLYVISSLGCALVHSGSGLLFWRVTMALGGGASIVISRAVVRDLYDSTEAARMFSLLMLVMGVSPILAPFVGGQFLLFTSWRGIFVFLGLFGFFSLCATIAWLPESLPQERRIPRRLNEMIAIYGSLLQNCTYRSYALALGAIAGLNFAYIAGAPHFFIELHDISPQDFGILFGINAFGLIGTSQLNRYLLRRYAAQRILYVAFACNVIFSILLTLTIITGVGGFLFQSLLLFLCISPTGLIFPNLMALALEPFATAAGSASALMGTVQYALGALAGVFVGLFHNGTSLPMILTMTVCALAGSLAFLAALTRE